MLLHMHRNTHTFRDVNSFVPGHITICVYSETLTIVNPLNPELNPTCYLLALLGDHHFLHVGRIRVKLLTLGY